MKHALLSLPLFLAACNVANEDPDGGTALDGGMDGGADGGASMEEVSTTDVCGKKTPLCAWRDKNMCLIMDDTAVGGGVYKVEKIELTTENSAPYYNPEQEKRPRTVAYITMVLTAHIWGQHVDGFKGRLALNDDCNLGVEDESYYTVGDEIVLTLYPDPDTGTYRISGACMQVYVLNEQGKASYGCIGFPSGLTVPEIQAVFEKAKLPDGTYDCAIPEGQCDYWRNPPDGGTDEPHPMDVGSDARDDLDSGDAGFEDGCLAVDVGGACPTGDDVLSCGNDLFQVCDMSPIPGPCTTENASCNLGEACGQAYCQCYCKDCLWHCIHIDCIPQDGGVADAGDGTDP